MKKTVSIKDNTGKEIQVEVSEEVYQFLMDSERKEYNQSQRDRRNLDRRELSDFTISGHELHPGRRLEQQAEERAELERIFAILGQCTATQRRRFIQHYVYGIPVAEMARKEEKNESAVWKSIHKVFLKLQG